MPDDRAALAVAPVIHLAGYEGPIDLLLELARSQKVDLGQLAIGALVDQYVAAVEASAAATLAERGDWLIAASWLVLLKSKLLGHDETEAAVLEAEQLRASLVRAEQRHHARALADWLERRPHLGRDVFARGAPEEAAITESTRGGDLLDLLLACFDLLAERTPVEAKVRRYTPKTPDVDVLADALQRLQIQLRYHPQGGELRIFYLARGGITKSTLRRRSEVASTFLAALELTRQGTLAVSQIETFGPIFLAPRSI